MTSIPLRFSVSEAGAPTRIPRILELGVPLPRGLLHDVSGCRVVGRHGQLRSQPVVRASWADGSVSWLGLSVEAPAGERLDWVLQTVPQEPSGPISPSERRAGDTVEMSSAAGTIGGDRAGITIRGPETAADVTVVLRSATGEHLPVAFDRVDLEDNGPLRATSVCIGRTSSSEVALNVIVRVTAHDSSPLIRCDVTVQNPQAAGHPGNCWELGDPGSIFVREVALQLRMRGERTVDVVELWQQGVWKPAPVPLLVVQESSGGAAWDSLCMWIGAANCHSAVAATRWLQPD